MAELGLQQAAEQIQHEEIKAFFEWVGVDIEDFENRNIFESEFQAEPGEVR